MQARPLTAVQPAASAPEGDALGPHAADQHAPPRARARARALALCNLPSNSGGGQPPASDSLADSKEKEPRLQGRQAKDMPRL